MAKVFLSYRRDDSGGYAGRLEDRLVRDFGSEILFMDVDNIPMGKNFVKVLRDEVAKCEVLLAVIGPHWLDARDEHGTRRLDNSNDFVRIEIATALQRNITVIPIINVFAPVDDQVLPKGLSRPVGAALKLGLLAAVGAIGGFLIVALFADSSPMF
jgi:hypothetical protein